MNRLILFFLLSGGLFNLTAQEIEVRKVGSFRGVKSSQAIDVYLKKGDREEVKVESSGIKLSDVITEVSGGTLRIHLDHGSYRKINVKVYVTYVTLEKVAASSASNIFSEGSIKASSIDVSASSAGSVEISIESQRVIVDASSAGNIQLEGKAANLEAEASSAGDVDAYNLEAEFVNAKASSGGSLKIMATKELDGHASSGGSIRYRGNPTRTNTGSSSGGSVKKSN